MAIAELIGSAGVFILLVAFMLNLSGRLSERSISYLIMNVFGATLAAWYAWVSGSIPFVVLEGTWATVSVVRLIGRIKSSGLNGTTA